jgi:hypothetical protein
MMNCPENDNPHENGQTHVIGEKRKTGKPGQVKNAPPRLPKKNCDTVSESNPYYQIYIHFFFVVLRVLSGSFHGGQVERVRLLDRGVGVKRKCGFHQFFIVDIKAMVKRHHFIMKKRYLFHMLH